MRIELLGAVRVVRGEQVIALPQMQRAVLAVLGLDVGRPVAVEALIDRLWDGPPPTARNAVQVHISGLRRALGRERVRSAAAGYVVDVAPDHVDVSQYKRLVTRGRGLVREGRSDLGASQLGAADRLWSGGALADARVSSWLSTAAESLAELRSAATVDRLAAELALGGGRDILPQLGQLLADQPLREDLHALRVRALVASGRTADALEAYRGARTVLRDELGIEPGPDLRAAHAEALAPTAGGGHVPGASTDGAPGHARDIVRGAPQPRLPRQLVRIIGRDRQVGEVARGLASRAAPVVTLVGPGGVGKTQVALAAATRAAQTFRDGAAWIELADVSTAGDVLPRLSALLGVGDSADAVGRLTSFLRDRELLLVLDNLEHVLDAVPPLMGLLRECAEVTALATSREPLGIPGEAVVTVDPLPLPAPGDQGAAAASGPAIELLVERATAVDPSYRPGPHDGTALAEIARRLDGLPLALELAAPRLALMGARDMVDQFPPIGRATSRAAPARQASLASALAWSIDQLDDDELAVLRMLAVFQTAVALETLTAVGADIVPEADVLTVVATLTRKNLAHRIFDADRRPRVRLLVTTRDHLIASAPADQLHQLRLAHAHWYRRITAPPPGYLVLRGPSDPVQTRAQVFELPDIQAAVRWSWDTGQEELACHLTVQNSRRWRVTGLADDLRSVLTRVVDCPAAGADQVWAAAHELAVLQSLHDDGSAARTDRVIDLARQTGNPACVVHALGNRAYRSLNLGRVAEAQPDLAEAQQLVDTPGYVGVDAAQLLYDVLWFDGVVSGRDRDHMRILGQTMITIARRSRLYDAIGIALHNVSEHLLEHDVFGEAFTLADEAWRIATDLDDRELIAATTVNRATALLGGGSSAAALAGLLEALQLWDVHAGGDGVHDCADTLIRIARACTSLGDHARAATVLGAHDVVRRRCATTPQPLEQRYHSIVVDEVSGTGGAALVADAIRRYQGLSTVQIVADVVDGPATSGR